MKIFKSIFTWHTRLRMRIEYWYWWNFQATEKQKVDDDMMWWGTGIMHKGKRVDPREFWPNLKKK